MAGSSPSIAVVIVNYRTPQLTRSCLASLTHEHNSLPQLRVIVVDGGSGDGSAEQLGSIIDGPEFRDWVQFLPLDVNGGFGWANNQAIQRLGQSGKAPAYVHLLNPDAQVEPGGITSLIEYLEAHPRVAAVGSQLFEPDGRAIGSAFSFPTLRGEFSRGARTGAFDRVLRVPPISVMPPVATEVDWVTGASVMFRMTALREAGLFDEGFFLYHEEVELMWRMRSAGWAIATEPRSRVRHIGGASTGVHNRAAGGKTDPRMPACLYRSRTRFFALTRGFLATIGAFAAWLVGHVVWRSRHVMRVGTGRPIAHEVRDHFLMAFPRRHDFIPAIAALEGTPTSMPAWMAKRWI